MSTSPLNDLVRNDDLVNESNPRVKGDGAILVAPNDDVDNRFDNHRESSSCYPKRKNHRVQIESRTCGKV